MAVTSTEPAQATETARTPLWRRVLGAAASTLVANIFRAIKLVWRSSPGWTVVNVVMIAIDAGLPVLLLLAFKEIIDATTAAMGSPEPMVALRSIIPALVLATVVAIVQAAAKAVGRLAQDAQGMAVTDYMIALLQSHAVALDLRYFEDTSYRNMLHRAQREAPFRPARTLSTLLDIGRAVLSLGAMLAVLISFHWAVIPALVLAGLPGGLARLMFAGRLHRLHVKQTEEARRAGYYESLLMGLANAQEVRLLALGQHFGDLSRRIRKGIRLERLGITKARLSVEFLAEALAIATMFGLIALLCWQALVGLITLGGLVMYVQALQRSWGNFSQLVLRTADLREHSLFIEDVYQFLDLKPTILPPALPKPAPATLRHGIAIDKVSFRYPGMDSDALHDVTMTIRPGEHVAIVGHNGSGKTTLIKLLCRVYDPRAGSITIDGTDLRDMDPEALRRLFSVHVQGFARFQDTARRNITLGAIHQDPDDQAVARAAAMSGADRVIERLPAGYDTMLGRTFEGGQELSAGQWQKLALARAFVRDTPIVVLDEPTAALDAETARELVDHLLELAVGRTAIVISHRLSAVMHTDRIFVLDQGRLVESGTHASLIGAGGRYAQLFRMEEATRP